MTAPQTSVLRDDKVMRINTADVVPGDIVVLGEGDTVSATGVCSPPRRCASPRRA